MPPVRSVRSQFCARKASEAREKAEAADTPYDFEFWSGLETKWSELAQWYEECEDLTRGAILHQRLH
jgi:hypothetical protein